MTANRAASIRARLKQHTDTSKQDFNLTLTRYGLERLLYRLSISEHAPNFLLKGALLFQLWYGQVHGAHGPGEQPGQVQHTHTDQRRTLRRGLPPGGLQHIGFRHGPTAGSGPGRPNGANDQPRCRVRSRSRLGPSWPVGQRARQGAHHMGAPKADAHQTDASHGEPLRRSSTPERGHRCRFTRAFPSVEAPQVRLRTCRGTNAAWCSA